LSEHDLIFTHRLFFVARLTLKTNLECVIKHPIVIYLNGTKLNMNIGNMIFLALSCSGVGISFHHVVIKIQQLIFSTDCLTSTPLVMRWVLTTTNAVKDLKATKNNNKDLITAEDLIRNNHNNLFFLRIWSWLPVGTVRTG
jgi:hypothetical protein